MGALFHGLALTHRSITIRALMNHGIRYIAGFLIASPLAHGETVKAAAAPVQQMDFLEILAKGGLMMFPLGLMSVITVILILLFFLSLRRNAIVSERFMATVESMIVKRDPAGLIGQSSRRNECMARIVQNTLEFMASNPGVPFENVREVAQTEGSRQAGLMTSRITYLADIGAIAPMVGLLGTVVGMIKAFIEISTGGVQGVREMGLAAGVSEALIATAGGLGISLVALIFYSFFRGRVHNYIAELESAATHFVALLHARYSDDASGDLPTSAKRRDLQGI